ncbi:MAG: SprT family zinc-dependent metalloprotease [bacterium]
MNKRQVIIKGQALDYIVRTNKRAKRLSLTIYPDGRLAITVPRGYAHSPRIEALVKSKMAWILKQRQRLANRQPLVKNTRANFLQYKEQARSLIKDRLSHYNQLYKFKVRGFAIRNQQTRWGSCSGKSQLNFNYRLVFLPTDLVDYIIVHELCHLSEMNHSSKFWHLVEQTVPDHKLRRRQLKKFHLA